MRSKEWGGDLDACRSRPWSADASPDSEARRREASPRPALVPLGHFRTGVASAGGAPPIGLSGSRVWTASLRAVSKAAGDTRVAMLRAVGGGGGCAEPMRRALARAGALDPSPARTGTRAGPESLEPVEGDQPPGLADGRRQRPTRAAPPVARRALPVAVSDDTKGPDPIEGDGDVDPVRRVRAPRSSTGSVGRRPACGCREEEVD